MLNGGSTSLKLCNKTIARLFLSVALSGCQGITAQRVIADTRTHTEQRKEETNPPPQAASPQPSGSSVAGADSSQAATNGSTQAETGSSPAGSDLNKRTELN